MQFVNSKEILPNNFSISFITKKAIGSDGISAFLLQSVIDALCEIVNISISTGKFHEAWKMAVVKPLHKGGSANIVNNYRLTYVIVFLNIFVIKIFYLVISLDFVKSIVVIHVLLTWLNLGTLL